MFRLALSRHLFFAFRDTNSDTLALSPCAAKHVMWQRVFRGAREFKVRNLVYHAKISLTSPNVINMPNRELLAGETKNSFVQRFEHLNNKNSVNKYLSYSERVILQFMCVGCWAGVTYLRYRRAK